MVEVEQKGKQLRRIDWNGARARYCDDDRCADCGGEDGGRECLPALYSRHDGIGYALRVAVRSTRHLRKSRIDGSDEVFFFF
jgi:hypothetical protein